MNLKLKDLLGVVLVMVNSSPSLSMTTSGWAAATKAALTGPRSKGLK